MSELKPTVEESIRHFESQQKRYMREHNGYPCPHYVNAINALRRAQPANEPLILHFGEGKIGVSTCRPEESETWNELLLWNPQMQQAIGNQIPIAAGTTTDDVETYARLFFHNAESAQVVVDALNKIIDSFGGNEPLTCKDCVYWKDGQVQLRDGSCRDYLPNEPWSVTADVGIDVGSHCTLHGFDNESGSWFWAKAEDFCSRGIRKPERSEG